MNRSESHHSGNASSLGEEPGDASLRLDLRHAANGLLMGGADIIPGVSGGTVALIVGIYARLITAISRFDTELVRLLVRRDWLAAWQRIDARFLAALGAGIGIGIIGLAKLMRYLLEFYHMQTLAVFFGLILGSSVLVARRIRVPRGASAAQLWTLGIAAAAVAWWLVGLPLLDPKDEAVSLWYIFICGAVAICAMILPGVSGAYFLLVFGLYYHVTDIIDRITHLSASLRDWTTVLVFASGCAAGLIGFSKVLRYLLGRFEMQTMAVLCGLMVGSLRKVWPFQVDTTPSREFKQKVFQPQWPTEITDLWVAGGLVAISALAVLLLETAANRVAVQGAGVSGRSLGSPAE